MAQITYAPGTLEKQLDTAPELLIDLPEMPEWTGRTVPLSCAYVDGKLHVFHPDDEKQLLPAIRIEIERRTRNLRVDIPKGDRVTLVTPSREVTRFQGVESALIPARREVDEEGIENANRNWMVADTDDGDVFRIWHPEKKLSIDIPIVSPSSDTPVATSDRPIFEPIGQQEMLFALALGIHLGKNTLLTGPTGIAKTTAYRWLASKLGYNLVIMPITRGTQDRHMVGEYMPAGAGDFPWTDGPVTRAARLSIEHPTILLLDEINRIGNVAEFARCYSLLDDTRMLELPERRQETGEIEIIRSGKLFIGATSNPTDDDNGDYIGVRELDPAFNSRLPIQPKLGYPDPDHERAVLLSRVPTLDGETAGAMVAAANLIRQSSEVRYPISFRELEAWALLSPYMGTAEAAEVAVVSKAALHFRESVRGLIKLKVSG